MVSSNSDAGPPEIPGVGPAARCGWCDAGRVEQLEVLWRDVATDAKKLVGYSRHMRLHITVDDELVAELDQRAGSRRRSAFIAELIRRGLDDERRWDDIEAALGAIPDEGHEWDDDPGEWVRRQRSDRRRVG
jgi:Arc/MetJ family transcription regulator